MTAKPSIKNPDQWIVKDGNDRVKIWITESGILTRRFTQRKDGSWRKHAVLKLDFEKVLLLIEGQLSIWDV